MTYCRIGRAHRFHLSEHDLRRHHQRSRLVLGGALIAGGLAWLLQNRGAISATDAWLAVPAVIAWAGVVRLAIDRGATSVVRALVRFALAAYLVVVIEHVGGLTWDATWPVLAIAAGLAAVLDAVFSRSRGDGADRADEEGAW